MASHRAASGARRTWQIYHELVNNKKWKSKTLNNYFLIGKILPGRTPMKKRPVLIQKISVLCQLFSVLKFVFHTMFLTKVSNHILNMNGITSVMVILSNFYKINKGSCLLLFDSSTL